MYEIIKFIVILAAMVCGLKAVLSLVHSASYDHDKCAEYALLSLKCIAIGFALAFLLIVPHIDF